MISKGHIEKALHRFLLLPAIHFDRLPLNEQEEIQLHSTDIFIKKNTILFKQGKYTNGVYILKKGKMKVYQANYDGSIQIMFIYSQGEVFGHRSIIAEENHRASVSALEDCELTFIDRKYFLELVKKSISLSNQLLVSLSHEFTILINRINVFAQRGIKERLALTLLILNEKYKDEHTLKGISEIKLSRTDLSNYVGTSTENLARTLHLFKEKNLIRVQGKSIFIESFEDLFLLASI